MKFSTFSTFRSNICSNGWFWANFEQNCRRKLHMGLTVNMHKLASDASTGWGMARLSPMLARKKKLPKSANRKMANILAHRRKKNKFFFFVLKKKNCQQNFFVSQIILLANFLWKSFVFLDFLRVFLLFFYFWKKNCQHFLLASQFFFLAKIAFFPKTWSQKKKLPTKTETANIGDSLPLGKARA